MDWFNDLGNMVSFFPDTPALAFDMAVRGASPELIGYDMAYGLQSAQTPLDVYPQDAMPESPGA